MRPLISLFIIFLIIFSPFLVYTKDTQEIHYQGTHILTYSAMNRLARAFKKKTGITVKVRGGGCADGIFGVTRKGLEMGGICCPINKEKLVQMGLIAHPVAKDIKTVIVNKKNPIRGLTYDQVKAIHQGKILNWKELGWTDRPIALIFRKHCLNMNEPVRRLFGIDSRLSNLADRAIIVRTDKELIDYVSEFPSAIGVTSLVFTKGKNVRRLLIDGVEPTPENAEKGEYPLTGTLYILTKNPPDRITKMFLDFVLSPEGQAIIRENLAGIR